MAQSEKVAVLPGLIFYFARGHTIIAKDIFHEINFDEILHNPGRLKILRIANFTFQREQMVEAQEMFRTSNKVTRPEKALILGFMAGSRGKKPKQRFYQLSLGTLAPVIPPSEVPIHDQRVTTRLDSLYLTKWIKRPVTDTLMYYSFSGVPVTK